MTVDHHAPYKVPDASIYKVEDCPKLLEVQKALARQGLKDPWLRNEAWRYNKEHFGTHLSRARGFFLRGFPYGFAAFLVTIGVEYAIKQTVGDECHDDKKEHGGH